MSHGVSCDLGCSVVVIAMLAAGSSIHRNAWCMVYVHSHLHLLYNLTEKKSQTAEQI